MQSKHGGITDTGKMGNENMNLFHINEILITKNSPNLNIGYYINSEQVNLLYRILFWNENP